MNPQQERELLELKIALQRLKIVREQQKQHAQQAARALHSAAAVPDALNEIWRQLEHYLPNGVLWQLGKQLSWKGRVIALLAYVLWQKRKR
ncbi:MAG: hypothetical protein Q4E16_00750 [Neisseria sp.]|nr:hypothetical protein [Neisseria sp.]